MSLPLRAAVRGAVLTVLTLLSGLIVGIAAGQIVFELLPDSNVERPAPLHVGLAALPALAGFLSGSAWWGLSLGRLAPGGAGETSTRRLAMAGALGFAPVTIVLAVALGTLEPLVLAAVDGRAPIHRIFTLLFVPSAFLIAGLSAGSLGLALAHGRRAWTLLWRVGLAAALAFLAANLVMEALGWVVGAPGAAERATMLVVLFTGVLSAALGGGAVLGWHLHHARPGPIRG